MTDYNREFNKLDELLSRREFAEAENYLSALLERAQSEHNKCGELAVINEQIGLFRKLGDSRALERSAYALRFINDSGIENGINVATTFLNAGTAYCAFGSPEKALPCYEKAEEIYNFFLRPNDRRFGALYNNYASAFMAAGDYSRSGDYFGKALSIMQNAPGGELDCAVTYCNLADLSAKEKGPLESEQEISSLLERAMEIFNSPSVPHNGYYAFVCEKCASAFGQHGFFLYEKQLKRRAEEIYERA